MKTNKKTTIKKTMKKGMSKLGAELAREFKNLKGTIIIGDFTITKK